MSLKYYGVKGIDVVIETTDFDELKNRLDSNEIEYIFVFGKSADGRFIADRISKTT